MGRLSFIMNTENCTLRRSSWHLQVMISWFLLILLIYFINTMSAIIVTIIISDCYY